MLIEDHNYSLTELEDMIPWEREMYVALIEQRMQENKTGED